MHKFLIAYDDNDADLGDYFNQSFQDIHAVISAVAGRQIDILNGLDSTETNIDSRIQAYNGGRFVFIGISHGDEPHLLTTNAIFVSDNNAARFCNSFFYTTACLTGRKLATKLLSEGCVTYVGFDDTVSVMENYYPVFIECENYAIKEFSRTDKSIKVVVEEMRVVFTDAYVNLLNGSAEDFLAATFLVGNRDKIVWYGNGDLTRADFNA